MKNTLQKIKVIALALILAVGVQTAFAWYVPLQAPPEGNTSAPLNVGADLQIKVGGLTVGNTQVADAGLTVKGKTVTEGSLKVNTSVSAPYDIGFITFGKSIFNGAITLADGSQGAGKVLTSDANGVASWQAVPVASGGGGGGTSPSVPVPGTICGGYTWQGYSGGVPVGHMVGHNAWGCAGYGPAETGYSPDWTCVAPAQKISITTPTGSIPAFSGLCLYL